MEQKINFKSIDDTSLVGIFNTTDVQPNEKCVILCHGFKVNKDEYGLYHDLKHELEQYGYDSFRFDFRAHGESDGIDYEMTIEGEVKDLKAAYDQVVERGYKDIYFISNSFAGGICTIFLSRYDNIVKKVIYINPLLDYRNNLLYDKHQSPEWNAGKEMLLEKNGYLEIVSKTTGRIFKLGKGVFDDARRIDPEELIQNIEIPMLFAHGKNDTSIPYQDSERIGAKCKHAEIFISETAMHGFHKSVDDKRELFEKIMKFLNK